MQQFKYTAYNLQKEKFSGIFIAEDEKDLARELAKQNLFLISSRPYSGGTPSAFFTLGTGKVSMDELTTFCRQFAIMTTAGMSLMNSLETIRKQNFSGYFKSILDVVYEDVKAGKMLSEAIDKHAKVFPDFFRSMIKVGEVSGKMDKVFNSLADYYENDTAVKKKAASALAYPIMLFFLTFGIFVLMMVYIVPTFQNSLSALDVNPTGISKWVFDTSDFILANWQYFVVGIIFFAGGCIGFGFTNKGKYFYDWLKLKVPIIKSIQISMLTARFARGFGLLLSSGLNIADALTTINVVLSNRDVQKRFTAAAEEVRVGIPLSVALEKYKIFPNLLIQMVAIGEKTASLDDVLMRTCGFFDRQAEDTITKSTNILQPIMLAIMGIIVGGMFIAIYSPMISIMESF